MSTLSRRRLLAGAGVAGAAALAGCTDRTGPLPRLVVATGENGGVYRPLGQALATAARPAWRATALRTAGSVDNLRRLRDGRATVAFTAVDVAADALEALGPFRAKFPVRALAGLYFDYVHLVVPSHSDVQTLHSLAGRSVSTGAPGSGTEVVATRLLAAAGITAVGFDRHRLTVTESAAALRAGTIDAFFFSGGIPVPAIAKLVYANEPPVKLADLSGYVNTLQSQYGEVYGSGYITTSTYGTPSVSTVSVPNVLAVPEHTPEDTAYRLTSLLFGAKSQLARAHPEGRQVDPRLALATFPVPMHPGAERYYRTLKQA